MAVLITFTTNVEYTNFTELIGFWYHQYVHYNIMDNTCSSLCDQFLQVTWSYNIIAISMANHNNECISQVVWADTFAIGCGASICDEIYPHAILVARDPCKDYKLYFNDSSMTSFLEQIYH